MGKKKIIWSNEATVDYHQNIDYLLNEWPERIAVEFIEDVETTLQLISEFPEMYPLTDYLEIRKAVVRKQISMYYKEE